MVFLLRCLLLAALSQRVGAGKTGEEEGSSLQLGKHPGSATAVPVLGAELIPASHVGGMDVHMHRASSAFQQASPGHIGRLTNTHTHTHVFSVKAFEGHASF